MSTKVYWFRHPHEHRNNLLRFGLMRLHYSGKIQYIEKSLQDMVNYGFGTQITEDPYLWHKSFLLVKRKGQSVRCMVDNEDSFVFVSELIKEVDVYFCAGYNSDLFEHKTFVNPYKWQDDIDLKWYRENLQNKIDKLGKEFYKIKKYIPIAPNLNVGNPPSAFRQKLANIEHRVRKAMDIGYNFSHDYTNFEKRYAQLLGLRNNELKHDIVLNDSLWGWPEHRINLHLKLQELKQKGYDIHSIIKWSEPMVFDGSIEKSIENKGFPLQTGGTIQNYEAMLSESRIAVFACGFHWGWRSILVFSLLTGIPVLTDRLLTEPYFDMSEFKIWQIEDHSWNSIEGYLKAISADDWNDIKRHNQKIYDKYMSPETVADYFIKTAFE